MSCNKKHQCCTSHNSKTDDCRSCTSAKILDSKNINTEQAEVKPICVQTCEKLGCGSHCDHSCRRELCDGCSPSSSICYTCTAEGINYETLIDTYINTDISNFEITVDNLIYTVSLEDK